MPLNPAYKAAKELERSFSSKLKFQKDRQGASYCMIPLAPNGESITIGGRIYQPQEPPHISIYELFQNNETNGLSVFHYTWHGFSQEQATRIPVVLHVYYDRTGRYLYSQLKNRETKEILSISPAEEKVLKQQATTNSKATLDSLVNYISKNHTESDELVNKHLAQLDILSAHLDSQLPKYISVAQQCINFMQQKDTWTFGTCDARAVLLKEIISAVEDKFKNQKKATVKSPAFYAAATSKKEQQETTVEPRNNAKKQPKNKQSTAQFPNMELQQKLLDADNKIDAVRQDSTIDNANRALTIMDLLKAKFSLLSQNKSSPLVENELIKVLQQINNQHNFINALFIETALNDDVSTLNLLRPFISTIKLSFFGDLIHRGNVAVCHYMIQNFDECLFYLNNCTLAYNADEEFHPLIYWAVLYREDPSLLKMLLESGANPNFYGVISEKDQGVLSFAIKTEKVEFVRILLENGANPNPEAGIRNFSFQAMATQKISKAQSKKPLQGLGTLPKMVSVIDNIPLFDAIATRNKEIIAHLLHHGASVKRKNNNRFDAIGVETCTAHYLPDPEIVQLLINHGANINAIQCEHNMQVTALLYACERNDLNSVKNFIALGANPNQILTTQAERYNERDPELFSHDVAFTPLQRAYVLNHREITAFLMQQKQQPINVIAAAMTFTVLVMQEGIGIHIKTLNFELPAKLLELKSFLFDRFDKALILSEMGAMAEQAMAYFKQGLYIKASHAFYAVMLLGDPLNRCSILYNLASSGLKSNELDAAIKFFTVCHEHDPDSKIGQYAAKQLEKLGALPSTLAPKT